MKTQKTKEGKVELRVPVEKTYQAAVFYNPEARLTRDISVAALQVFQKQFKDKLSVLDALSATGVRGLRYAKEVKNLGNITLNDKNPLAFNLIRKNIKLNKPKKCLATKKDANLLMRENVFGFIDLDPFGPPVQFLDSAARSVYHKGFLAVTATDLTALCGAFPDACFRKYGLRSKKTDYYDELGMRILISAIIRTMAIYERAFIPVLSFSSKHYFRVFGKIEHSGNIKSLLKEFKYVEDVGLLYLGKIQDKKFCKEVLREVKKRKFDKSEIKLLETIIDEVDTPFYFDLHKIAKKHKIELRKIDGVIQKLKKKGFKASRTHFCSTGIKTNVEENGLLRVLRR